MELELAHYDVPIHIISAPEELPPCLRGDSMPPKEPMVVGFDCEGVDLGSVGQLCIMQVRVGAAMRCI